jgi:DNA-binding IclR family transcriptional regulator
MNAVNENKPDNKAQQRLIAVLEALVGYEINGLSLTEIATALGITPSVALRDLRNLEATGWAENIPTTHRWRAGKRFAQKAIKVLSAFDKAERDLTDLKNRYTREPA